MLPKAVISIDQNSHALWDTLPKVEALAKHGIACTHYLEDVDVAFTRQGATPGDHQLELARERYYRSGTSDWGASLFYSDFLGRSPLDIRSLEPYTGRTTRALAHALDLTVDELYQRLGASDNWQLIGPSYLTTDAHQHRVIGDLRVNEVAEHVRHLIDHARRDLLARFTAPDAQKRTNDWFNREFLRVQTFMASHADGRLIDLYRAWMEDHIATGVQYRETSQLFADGRECAPKPFLEPFLQDYDALATLYNEALDQSGVPLTPLDTRARELPFFAVWRVQDRMYRTNVHAGDNGTIRIGERVWQVCRPDGRLCLKDMHDDGLVCLTGKAVVLVLQARHPDIGGPLVIPHQGSLYMPAAHAFERLLRQHGYLRMPLHPLFRLRFRFLEAIARSKTPVALPPYLHGVFSEDHLPATQLAEELPTAIKTARSLLHDGRQNDAREALVQTRFPSLSQKIEAGEHQRRELARNPETRNQASAVWDEVKALKKQRLSCFVDQILQARHVSALDYWDSRGALLPWSIALGGRHFYDDLLEHSELCEESADDQA